GEAPVIGHYHSHPSGVAVPSPRDAADAMPDGMVWLIVGGREVRAWRAVAAGEVEGRFDPVAITPTLPAPFRRFAPPSSIGRGKGPAR
ncbi:Mov34/MPN/PAD-1 family protein, partial [Streptococcus agalactiae]|uniref:Mov34/MPN/PAD-1 family protein n=2 Tax=Bacteria TaxID=2 RepID=UPI0020BD869C